MKIISSTTLSARSLTKVIQLSITSLDLPLEKEMTSQISTITEIDIILLPLADSSPLIQSEDDFENTYRYVNNDPVNNVDPSGLQNPQSSDKAKKRIPRRLARPNRYGMAAANRNLISELQLLEYQKEKTYSYIICQRTSCITGRTTTWGTNNLEEYRAINEALASRPLVPPVKGRTSHFNSPSGNENDIYSFIADFIPVVNQFKAGNEAFAGVDPVTGKELTTGGRVLSGFGLIPFGKLAGKAGKGLFSLFTKSAKNVNKAANVTTTVTTTIIKQSDQVVKHGDDAADVIKHTDEAVILLNKGNQRAPTFVNQSLLDSLKRRGYDVQQSADVQKYLNLRGANAATFLQKDILLKMDPRKVEVLEEFLHNVQHRKGLTSKMNPVQLEIHVKDFMIRHKKMLGLSPGDVKWLEKSLEEYKKIGN